MSIDKLQQIIKKNSRLIIGTMSGMSHDSLDLALVRISGNFPDLVIELIETENFNYTKELNNKIYQAKKENTEFISKLNFQLAYFYSEKILDFIKKCNLNSLDIDAIGSHGQTIFHDSSKLPKHTLQISSGSVIAKKTGIITISNFREADLAVGGNGAPLVPYVDFLLYRKEPLPISLNNLGSISNLTLVTENPENIIAFDTGPANMPIDFMAKKIKGNDAGIDKDGKLSGKGQIISELLSELLNSPYFKLPPPKAAGYLEFGPQYLENTYSKYDTCSSYDLLRTAVEFSAQTITNAYKDFIIPKHPNLNKIIFTGGGSKNQTLIKAIKGLLPNIKIELLSQSDNRFNTAKEALSFAVLANEFLSNRPANIPSATGASQKTILGQLSLP